MAGTWSVVFEEPPSARSTATAFSKALWVIILDCVILYFINSNICSPDSRASRIFFPATACVVAQYGRLIPIDSVIHAIVLAVNRPAQEPGPGQAHLSSSFISSSLILPDETAPTAS